MPSAVTAFCNVGKYHNIEVEDEAIIYTEYANGATGVFVASTGDCPGTNRLEITGTRGKLVLEQGVLKSWRLREDEREICRTSENSFVNPEADYREFTAEKESGHAGILQNFANAVLHGEKLLAPGFDGIYELTISNAAYLSQWNGNKRITLPFDCDEFDRLLAKRRNFRTLRKLRRQSLRARAVISDAGRLIGKNLCGCYSVIWGNGRIALLTISSADDNINTVIYNGYQKSRYFGY